MPFDLEPLALKDIVRLLDREERSFLFQLLSRTLKGFGHKSRPRLVEEIALKVDMQKTHVYRYLNGKIIPNDKTTLRIVDALFELGETETVLEIFEPIATRMRKDAKEFVKWRKYLKEHSIIYSPISKKAIENAEKLLY